MGKAQSKRSLEITSETKKDAIEEGTGEMKKIEDVDQLKPQVNGDTHHNEAESTDKEKTAETENEKDLSTEKEQQQKEGADESQKQIAENGGGGDDGTAAEQKPVENGNDETLNESKAADSTAANADDESSKKKKEKKKKWSFRNISFGKRDKQKPAKKEEAAVNGECEKVPEETNDETAAAKDGENKAEASTPDVEEKPQNDEAKTEDKTEAAPATNGVAEDHTPEQPATEQKTPEVTVPPSTEEKKSTPPPAETVNNDDKQKIEAVAENGDTKSTEPQQESQPAVATKIEVKDDHVPDENILEKSKIDESNVQNQEQQVESENTKNVNLVGDGDSENAQNLTPPPLPNIPPPSQVMVFALGDIKDNAQDQPQLELIQPQIEIKPTETLNEPKQIAEVAAQPTIETIPPSVPAEKVEEPTTAGTSPPPLEQPKTEEPIVQDEPKQECIKEEIPTATIPEVQAEKPVEHVDVAPKAEIESPKVVESPKLDETAQEEGLNVEQPAGNSVKDQPQEEKPDSDINPEQIAKTIALIDEVTQEAVLTPTPTDETSAQLPNASQQNENISSEPKTPEQIPVSETQSPPEPITVAKEEVEKVEEKQIEQPQQKDEISTPQKQDEIIQKESQDLPPPPPEVTIESPKSEETTQETVSTDKKEEIIETIPTVIDKLIEMAAEHVEKTQQETKTSDSPSPATDEANKLSDECSKTVVEETIPTTIDGDKLTDTSTNNGDTKVNKTEKMVS